MDKYVIDQFWRARSAQGDGRWTNPTLLEFEVDYLSRLVKPNARILDLGSGSACLSFRLLSDTSTLTAVDKYPDFLAAVPRRSNVSTVCCDVMDFDFGTGYDLILLFGVVTHLELDQEQILYRRAATGLAPEGILVVKNQVSRSAEKSFDGYSENLKCRYVGRYPSLEEQTGRLQDHFSHVHLLPYPDDFNPWPDTRHAAFICTQK